MMHFICPLPINIYPMLLDFLGLSYSAKMEKSVMKEETCNYSLNTWNNDASFVVKANLSPKGVDCRSSTTLELPELQIGHDLTVNVKF